MDTVWLMKWVWIILLIIIGIIAAVFAFEYLTVGIGHLPSWVPGHRTAISVPTSGKCPDGWHKNGSFCYKRGRKRPTGFVAISVAVVAFGGAGWLIYKNQRATHALETGAN